MDVNQLQSQNIAELTKFANELEVEEISGLSKQELIVKILEAHNKKEGILQLLKEVPKETIFDTASNLSIALLKPLIPSSSFSVAILSPAIISSKDV